ncbi:MAG: hypothetical protein CMJ40_06870 [Phycisphaerae bacterium]|nr:hypothetical protein [Phycisphaerae bacterium]|tara:strand:- start:445 stop:1254 length:810 start_codon:yes stop_codon:yes gene_type:complete
MGAGDDLIADAVWTGAQLLYFKFKNNKRAKAFDKWSNQNQFKFWAKGKDYNGLITKLPTPDASAARKEGGRVLSAKAKMASRYFGESQIQTKLWSYCTNRFRGDWQTNANIMEGAWKGETMTAFDTLWFQPMQQQSEGEYSSVFAHSPAPLPRVIISPSGILAGLKRLDENQFLNLGYHKIDFELDSFNKQWKVKSTDAKLAYDFISQSMMEYLMDHKNEKWHLEMGPEGVLISTIFTLTPAKIELAMDFLAGFMGHIDQDLLETKNAP